jgi:PhoH-like ATPase
MQPIFDNLEVIIKTPPEDKEGRRIGYRGADYLVESGMIQVEPLTFIRGRSLPRRYFVLDEAQNSRPIDVKTLLTRCGEGTKVILCGDLEQVDHPFLDSTSNGLAYLISRFIDDESFCYLNLLTGARSALAEKAARLL